MPRNLKPIRESLYRHPYAVFLLIFLVEGTLRWFTGVPNDRVIVFSIFMFVLFLFNRVGEILRRSDALANELCQAQDKGHKQAEQVQYILRPVGNQNEPNWWG